MEPNIEAFSALFERFGCTPSPEAKARLAEFYRLVLKENEIQNLTRLTEPEDFSLGTLWIPTIFWRQALLIILRWTWIWLGCWD